MSYAVLLSSHAQRDLDRLVGTTLLRLEKAILKLESDPRPHEAKKLKGATRYWRVRVGDYRVLYEIEDEARRVVVHRIAHRREIYR
jgi:mRNA interferase RelE/StbE